jgi:hypothetical protein
MSTEEKANWGVSGRTKVLLALCIDAYRKNPSAEGFKGIKAAEWTGIVNDFNMKLALAHSRKQLQSRISSLKTGWVVWNQLKSNSGFGWDDTSKLPTASNEVWNAYLIAHPTARSFRNVGLDNADLLDELFSGV